VNLRRRDEIADTLVLCEHPPVYTIGRAARDASNLGAGEEYLRSLGAEVFGAIGAGTRRSTDRVRSSDTLYFASRSLILTSTCGTSRSSHPRPL
jgi:hypothetical protein